ncbi:MAG: hypothetical protein HeimC3_23870 [Candidatus Heimdallarchaeota archaeon LC_3]|nr:MAG: hypothetical protein HeimC3_23870 [Candidatus Heimdallarchaeota archaeon LC_3]
MILSLKINEPPWNEFDTILGTPSAQKIIRILVTWDVLSVKSIVKKSNLSESQVHVTLKQLKRIDLIDNQSRGVYKLANNKFAKNIFDTYLGNNIEMINWKIAEVINLIKNKNFKQAKRNYKKLIQDFDPILEKHFIYQMDSLAKRILTIRE